MDILTKELNYFNGIKGHMFVHNGAWKQHPGDLASHHQRITSPESNVFFSKV